MVGEEATLSTNRRARIAELLKAVQDHQFNSHTLEEIVLILDHECLCWKYQNGQDILAGHDANALRPLLDTSQTDELTIQLSACLVRSINNSSHYERELQSKALLSAVALLHAQGVRALQSGFHDSLRQQFIARFQDLHGVPEGRVFSADTFRILQCSYYLCLGAEYAKRFTRAEPIIVSVVSYAINVLVVASSITGAALVSLWAQKSMLWR